MKLSASCDEHAAVARSPISLDRPNSIGRAAKFQRAFRLRLGGCRGLKLAGFDPRRLYPRADLGTRRVGGARTRAMWTGDRPCQQHLRSALMLEIAISEAHAGHRAAEAALVFLVQVEAGLERQ